MSEKPIYIPDTVQELLACCEENNHQENNTIESRIAQIDRKAENLRSKFERLAKEVRADIADLRRQMAATEATIKRQQKQLIVLVIGALLLGVLIGLMF